MTNEQFLTQIAEQHPAPYHVVALFDDSSTDEYLADDIHSLYAWINHRQPFGALVVTDAFGAQVDDLCE